MRDDTHTPFRPARRRLLLGLGAGLGALALAAPLGSGPARADAPLTVVATTGMLADAVRVVGGDLVAVRALMGPGMDPHGHRLTRSDITALDRADLVVWNGLFLEAQMEDFLGRLATSKPVLAAAETLPRDRLKPDPDYPDRLDPHVWMDPRLWSGVVDAIRDALVAARPADTDAFRAAAAAHQTEIAALHAYSARVLGSVPEGRRILVTAHDAFGYFGAAYGFEVEGVQGLSTDSEAGLRRITDLVDLLVTRGIGAVFVESSVSDRNMRALIEGAAARGHQVRIGAELFSDAMGPDGTWEGTWRGMIDHNVTAIARALGGEAPPRGMADRLSTGS